MIKSAISRVLLNIVKRIVLSDLRRVDPNSTLSDLQVVVMWNPTVGRDTQPKPNVRPEDLN